ncbi:MAG: hypothetical protein ACM3ZQ_08020 [Bacillota bacterium]
MSDDRKRVWNIDLCEDNLRDAVDAREAVERLKEILAGYDIIYTEQSCIHACRPCHEGALIVRLDDELITGETNEQVIDAVIALVARRG